MQAQEEPTNTPAGSSMTAVVIQVNDLDDNSPVFSHDQYTGQIVENTPTGVSVTLQTNMTVSDKDQVRITNVPSKNKEAIPQNKPKNNKKPTTVRQRAKTKKRLINNSNKNINIKFINKI